MVLCLWEKEVKVGVKEYIVQAYAQETIEKFDNMNAPEIVRCKDCKYCKYPKSEKEWCKKGHLHGNAENWFCADAERR